MNGNLKSNPKSKSLEKKILSMVQLIFPYVKQRLNVAVDMGIVPKNMYKPNELIDEVILEIYENNPDDSIESNQLMLLMFSLANKKLNKLYENEKFHKKTISTKLILEQELASLEEKFTVDGGFDLIMNEELDDISYNQNDENISLLHSDEIQQDFIDFLELENNKVFEDKRKKNMLQKMYQTLPFQTSNIVDLYVLGKLNFMEVASVVQYEIIEVKKIIEFVKENFKKHLI